MEAIGGIIIFFSWVITNTIHQNYKDLKKSLESANGNFRLYNTLHEIRGMVDSVAAEVIKRNPNDMEASRFRSGKHWHEEIERIRNEFDMVNLNARQVKNLMDFTAEVNALSLATDDDTSTHDQVQSMLREVGKLQDAYFELERPAKVELNKSNTFDSPDNFVEIPKYISSYRNHILPLVPDLFRRIVNLSNERKEEAELKLSRLKKRSKIMKYVSMVSYIIGTVLILWNKLITNIA